MTFIHYSVISSNFYLVTILIFWGPYCKISGIIHPTPSPSAVEKEAWRPASLQVTEVASPQPEAQTSFPGLHAPWPQNSRTATPSPTERVRTIAQPHPVPQRVRTIAQPHPIPQRVRTIAQPHPVPLRESGPCAQQSGLYPATTAPPRPQSSHIPAS